MLNLPIDHIGLHCSDVELNAKWYQEELGFKVAGKFPGMGGRNVYFLENPQDGKMYEISQRDQLPGGATTRSFNFWEKGSRCFKIESACGEVIEICQKIK